MSFISSPSSPKDHSLKIFFKNYINVLYIAHICKLVTQNAVTLKDFYHTAHHLIEAKQKRRISHEEMAESLGASTRAYAEWLKGGREPLAASGAIKMLAQLEDSEIVKIVREFAIDTN